MNKKIFKQLCMNYNREADKELYELWEYNLRCFDEDEMQKAVGVIITQDKFFPTLNRMLEVLKDIVSKENVIKSELDIREKMKKHNIHPEWLDKEIINEPIDEEIVKEFEDFNNFLEEFRNEQG